MLLLIPLFLLLNAEVSAFLTHSQSPRVLSSKANVACVYCAHQKRRLSKNTFQLKNSNVQSDDDCNENTKDDIDGAHYAKIQHSAQSSESTKGVVEATTSKKSPKSPLVDKYKFPNILDGMKNMFSSIFNKKFGSRGEIYVISQIFLMYGIMIGHIPLLKNFFEAVFGPIMFLIGAGVMIHSINEMGSAFTAYSTPVGRRKGGRLVMTGLYEYVRHPVYTGNIACLIGISIMTGSAMRLLLTGVYWLLVEMKTKEEEKEMKQKFGLEYGEYCKRVPHKYIPFSIKNENTEVPTHKWKFLDGAAAESSASEPIATSSSSSKDDGPDQEIKGKSSRSNLFP